MVVSLMGCSSGALCLLEDASLDSGIDLGDFRVFFFQNQLVILALMVAVERPGKALGPGLGE